MRLKSLTLAAAVAALSLVPVAASALTFTNDFELIGPSGFYAPNALYSQGGVTVDSIVLPDPDTHVVPDILTSIAPKNGDHNWMAPEFGGGLTVISRTDGGTFSDIDFYAASFGSDFSLAFRAAISLKYDSSLLGVTATAGTFSPYFGPGLQHYQFHCGVCDQVTLRGFAGAPFPKFYQTYFTGLVLDDVKLTAPDVTHGGVPEPSTWALMLVGFGGLGFMLRRRHHAIA